jgi:hypothetical protein
MQGGEVMSDFIDAPPHVEELSRRVQDAIKGYMPIEIMFVLAEAMANVLLSTARGESEATQALDHYVQVIREHLKENADERWRGGSKPPTGELQ